MYLRYWTSLYFRWTLLTNLTLNDGDDEWCQGKILLVLIVGADAISKSQTRDSLVVTLEFCGLGSKTQGDGLGVVGVVFVAVVASGGL